MKLKEFLQKTCITPDKFAEEIGVNRRTIYSILCGNRARLDTAIKIFEFSNGLVDYKDLDKVSVIKIKGIKKEKSCKL